MFNKDYFQSFSSLLSSDLYHFEESHIHILSSVVLGGSFFFIVFVRPHTFKNTANLKITSLKPRDNVFHGIS